MVSKLEPQILALQEQLQQFPDGSLRISKDKNSYRWYYSHNHQIKSISKANRPFAESLAFKQYLNLELSRLIHERDALLLYLNQFPQTSSPKINKLIASHEFKNLLSSHIVSNDQFIRNWLETPFTPNPSHPEHLIYPSITGQMRRSKSETIIEASLFRHQLPYRYECPVISHEFTLYPDFTILHPHTHKIFYWDHFGMADDPGYALKIGDRLKDYCSIQIIPGNNLILTFETKDHPLDAKLVEDIIQYYFSD